MQFVKAELSLGQSISFIDGKRSLQPARRVSHGVASQEMEDQKGASRPQSLDHTCSQHHRVHAGTPVRCSWQQGSEVPSLDETTSSPILVGDKDKLTLNTLALTCTT